MVVEKTAALTALQARDKSVEEIGWLIRPVGSKPLLRAETAKSGLLVFGRI